MNLHESNLSLRYVTTRNYVHIVTQSQKMFIVTCIDVCNIYPSVLGHQLFWFNSRPDSPGTNYGRCVDVLAPGQWIRSASHRYVIYYSQCIHKASGTCV